MKTINLISMAKSYSRREKMLTQFAQLGLEYRVVDAVDGTVDGVAEDWEIDFEAFRKIYGRDIRGGEIGCYASHLKALDYILASESDYGIVMEDDIVMLMGNLPESKHVEIAIEDQVSQAPKGWSLIYPGNPLMWGSHRYKNVGYGHENQGKFNEHFTQHADLEELSKALIGTQCYLISVEFAAHIVEFWNKIYRPIDEVYRHLCLDSRFKMFHFARHLWICRPNWEEKSQIHGT